MLTRHDLTNTNNDTCGSVEHSLVVGVVVAQDDLPRIILACSLWLA
jgi:hypothetical protein